MRNHHALLFAALITGCAAAPSAASGPKRTLLREVVRPSRPAATPEKFQYAVATSIGDAEFKPDDSITIESVHGTKAVFAVGGVYEIRGHYRLGSVDRASLHAAVNTHSKGRPFISPRNVARVTRGEGEFVLEVTLRELGHPNLTFYDEEGSPVGGVYFGAEEWLLRNKGWGLGLKSAPPDPNTGLKIQLL